MFELIGVIVFVVALAIGVAFVVENWEMLRAFYGLWLMDRSLPLRSDVLARMTEHAEAVARKAETLAKLDLNAKYGKGSAIDDAIDEDSERRARRRAYRLGGSYKAKE